MRPKSMILIVIALGCGLIASIGISQVINTEKEEPEAIKTEKIYVAVKEIELGSLMTPKLVKLEEWPKDRIPEGAVRSLEEIDNQRSLVRFFSGEPVLTPKLIDKDKFHDPTMQIPEGYRVVTIGVSATSNVGHLVKPGDKVDAMVFLKGGKYSVRGTRTKTFLRGITIFAVNTKLKRNEENDVIKARNVSLLVTPEQAQIVMLAAEIGDIRFVLRRKDEMDEESIEDTTVGDLLGNGSSNTDHDEPKETIEPATSGITDFLEDMKGSQPNETDSNHGWEMAIMYPDGTRTLYNWDDKTKLPTNVGSTVDKPAAPGANGGLDPNNLGENDPAAEFGDDELDWQDSNPLDLN